MRLRRKRHVPSCAGHHFPVRLRGHNACAEKRDAFPERLASFGNQVRSKRPGMRDNRPDFQFDENTRSAGAFGEPRGIVAQDFVRAYVNEKRRKSGEIGIERRCERIAWIGVAEIIASGCRDGGRERTAGGAKSEHERERKTTSCGLTGDHNAFRRVTRAEKRAVKGNGIIHSGGKPILGREAIVRGENAKPMERIVNSDGPMRLCRATKVSAAVKIEEHDIAERWAFDAFAGNAAEVYGRNLNCWRNSVGIGTKDAARDAIIAHALQTALDAPFDDPN